MRYGFKLLVIIFTCCSGIHAAAQTGVHAGANTRQIVSLRLANAISVSIVNSNQEHAVNIPFATPSDYINGATSTAQELKIQSNIAFNIAVSTRKTYELNTESTPANGLLGLIIDNNATGGNIAAPFNSKKFSQITNSPQNLISTATNGGNQTFSVIYLANPQLHHQPDEFSISENVIYTTTQL